MNIDVKSQFDETKVGVLTITDVRRARIQTGHTLKVYNERRSGDQLVLFCMGNPGGYAQNAVLLNGNFKPGDVLVVENVYR